MKANAILVFVFLFLGMGLASFWGQALANHIGAEGWIVPGYTLGIIFASAALTRLSAFALSARMDELTQKVEALERCKSQSGDQGNTLQKPGSFAK